jgi:hypothetical protein
MKYSRILSICFHQILQRKLILFHSFQIKIKKGSESWNFIIIILLAIVSYLIHPHLEVLISFLLITNVKYDASSWDEGIAADYLESSSKHPNTSNPKLNGHPDRHVLSGRNLQDLIKMHEKGLEVPLCPMWESYKNRASKNKNRHRKTGFNREDQQKVFHEIFTLDCGKKAIETVSSTKEPVILEVPAWMLKENGKVSIETFVKGVKDENASPEAFSFILKLGRFADEYQQSQEKIHVTTFYPQNETKVDAYEVKILNNGERIPEEKLKLTRENRIYIIKLNSLLSNIITKEVTV